MSVFLQHRDEDVRVMDNESCLSSRLIKPRVLKVCYITITILYIVILHLVLFLQNEQQQ